MTTPENTSGPNMSDLCALCGKRFGQHNASRRARAGACPSGVNGVYLDTVFTTVAQPDTKCQTCGCRYEACKCPTFTPAPSREQTEITVGSRVRVSCDHLSGARGTVRAITEGISRPFGIELDGTGKIVNCTAAELELLPKQPAEATAEQEFPASPMGAREGCTCLGCRIMRKLDATPDIRPTVAEQAGKPTAGTEPLSLDQVMRLIADGHKGQAFLRYEFTRAIIERELVSRGKENARLKEELAEAKRPLQQTKERLIAELETLAPIKAFLDDNERLARQRDELLSALETVLPHVSNSVLLAFPEVETALANARKDGAK